MPRVSVIIPTYNRRAYVQEAIDSVLAQTYTDYEIIVIDDGSTDGTGEALRARYGDRIHYEWQENQANRGLVRNLGASYAQGEFICFLDDDDRFLPSKLEMQVAYLTDHTDVDLVAGGLIRINEAGKIIDQWPLWQGSPELSFEACIEDGCHMQFGAMLMRRTWFDQVGGISTELPLVQDTDFFLRLLLAGCSMAWQQVFVAQYRVHANNTEKQVVVRAWCRHRMISDLLSRPDVPQSVRARSAYILSAYALDNAARCYAVGEAGAAKEFLQHATVGADCDGSTQKALLERLLSACGSFYGISCYEAVRRSLGLVVADARVAVDLQRDTLGKAAQKSFYTAWQRRDYGSVLSNSWRAAVRRPFWLLNIGTWSILLRSLWRWITRRGRETP